MNHPIHPIHHYPKDALALPEMASWPASQHQFEHKHILALRAAQATGRPLLVRGEAGTGKSQLAHAAAFVTGRAFLPVVVGNTTEATDLHWKFDAIGRLADAHALANHTPTGDDAAPSNLYVKHYVQPGHLWWALDWESALAQHHICRHGAALVPSIPENWQAENGVVLLIDEIDKAELDLPNGLLEALANGAFEVPLLGITVRRAKHIPPPLIIITTNEERELPAAFLRRCLVLTLALPRDDAALRTWLCERGRLHFPLAAFAAVTDPILDHAASLLINDRKSAREQGCYLPGLAEYLDLLRAIAVLGADGVAAMDELKDFYFDKQPLENSAYSQG